MKQHTDVTSKKLDNLPMIMMSCISGVPLVFDSKGLASFDLITRLLKDHNIRYSLLVDSFDDTKQILWVANYDKGRSKKLMDAVNILEKHMEPINNIEPFASVIGAPYFLRSESGNNWLIFSTRDFKDPLNGIMAIKSYLEITSEERVLTTSNQLPVNLNTTRVADCFELMDSSNYLGMGAIYLRYSIVSKLKPYLFDTMIVTHEYININGEKVDNSKSNLLRHIPIAIRESYEFKEDNCIELYGEQFEFIKKEDNDDDRKGS